MNSKEMKSALKWGIIGLGNIAHQFAKDLQLVEGSKIVSVASRNLSKAFEFGAEYGVVKCYGNYNEILDDPDVDIVYVATPHNSHVTLSVAAMNAGKHVLCEKPLAVNKHEVNTIISAARNNQVFMMEAFWSRFNPSIVKAMEVIRSGEIGEINYLNVDFTFFRNDNDDSRMLNMDLAGGSLLDMGVYPVFLSYLIFGIPEDILATGRFHKTGVDIQTSAILKYPNGIANVFSGFASQSDMVAKIYGTKGAIFIQPIWHESQGIKIRTEGKMTLHSLPTKGKGFTYEIEECMRCIQNGQLESDQWSHQNSLDLITITDEIRDKIGLRYPFENKIQE
ncbi:MAG: Gfo/Idh/MocA family oxidoreductase [Bacteroidota bacterium]